MKKIKIRMYNHQEKYVYGNIVGEDKFVLIVQTKYTKIRLLLKNVLSIEDFKGGSN